MITADLNRLTLLDSATVENPETTRGRVAFPLYAATGAKHSACVYFELDPGCNIGAHTDSAEEIVLVLEGTVEGTIGEERGVLTAGQLALIPKLVPHDLKNVGTAPAKIIGFFADSLVTSTFTETIRDTGSNVAGTPPVPAPQPLTWNQIAGMLMQGEAGQAGA